MPFNYSGCQKFFVRGFPRFWSTLSFRQPQADPEASRERGRTSGTQFTIQQIK